MNPLSRSRPPETGPAGCMESLPVGYTQPRTSYHVEVEEISDSEQESPLRLQMRPKSPEEYPRLAKRVIKKEKTQWAEAKDDRQEIKDIEAKLHKLKKKVEKLVDMQQRFSQTLREKEEKITKLRDIIKKHAIEVEEGREKIKEMEEIMENNGLPFAYEEYGRLKKIEVLEKQLSETKHELAQALEENKRIKENINHAELMSVGDKALIMVQKDEISELKKLLAEKTDTASGLTQRVYNLSEKEDSLQKELEAQKTKYEKEIRALQAELKETRRKREVFWDKSAPPAKRRKHGTRH